MYKLYIFLAICLLISCSTRYSPEIEEVLKQAGNNRGELEKVLRHYGENPADSLKLRAAEFLIVNMPGKYSEYYDAPWNDIATVYLRSSSSSDIMKVLDAYRIGDPVKQEDVRYITSEYLINNIDLSFKVWQERPWGKHIPFDAFCEEILPYRIDCEPLENWRKKALASFADLDSILNKPTTTAIEACCVINKILPRFRIDKDFSQMCFSQLMATPRGTCNNMTALATFAMRALGIPVTIDFTPRWVEYSSGHSWNTVRDSAGNHVVFMGVEANPYRTHLSNTALKAKAYRKMYALQQHILTEDKHVPYSLRIHKSIKDITSEHTGIADSVTVPLTVTPSLPSDYVYLALLQGGEWYPVAWASIEERSALFTSVGKDIVYLPVYFCDGRQIPAGHPFLLDMAGNMITFFQHQDTLLTFDRITFSPKSYSSLMYQGVFEGGDKPDFSDARILHTINHVSDFWQEVILKKPVSCRYARYKSPLGASCNVAEIVFYGKDMKKISGTIVGTSGSLNNAGMTCDKVFDGNLMTFFNAPTKNDAWTGLDFNARKTIHKIQYYPRTIGDFIYEGHEYELFFRTKARWVSLGKQVATHSDSIQFQAPSQGLFYLKNITLDRKGEVILFANGQKKYLMNK
jgi:hypothetical protein